MAHSQHPVSKDGVSIDLKETAIQASRNVDRDKGGIPVHACGKRSHRECPCWICTSEDCAACFASCY